MKSRNELLNIMEAIAAILVVLIHYKFPGETGNMVTAIARVSVPFFFSISGYFFFRDDAQKELASIPKKIRKLLLLILGSECVYFLFYLMLQVDNYGFTIQALMNVIELEILKPYRAELAIRLAVFAPPLNGVFWFVGSLVVVYLCVFAIVKYRCQHEAFIASLVFLATGFVLRRILAYLGVSTLFPYERLLPFLPLPFFMIGYYIRKHQNLFDQIGDAVYYAVFVGGILMVLLEERVSRGGHTLYAGTLLLVPAMVSFGGKQKEFTAKSWTGKFLSHLGADTGTYLYMLHMMIGNICAVIAPRFLRIDPQQKLFLWLFPVLVCVSSVICGEAIYVTKRILIKKR